MTRSIQTGYEVLTFPPIFSIAEFAHLWQILKTRKYIQDSHVFLQVWSFGLSSVSSQH